MIGYELENKESRENLHSPAEFWRNSRYSVGFGELECSGEKIIESSRIGNLKNERDLFLQKRS
jgi:hypothetical protein